MIKVIKKNQQKMTIEYADGTLWDFASLNCDNYTNFILLCLKEDWPNTLSNIRKYHKRTLNVK